MDVYDLIVSRRTIREFEDTPIERKLLERWVNAGRLAPQAANRQPLEFVVIDDQLLCKELFPLVKFAGSLDWNPSEHRMPRAYIAIIVNGKLKIEQWVDYDVALAAGNISLAAWGDGVGSCLVGAFDRRRAVSLLSVPEDYGLPLLVAFGYPAHESFVEDAAGDEVKYRRDADGTFHVPKRPLSCIIHHNGFKTNP